MFDSFFKSLPLYMDYDGQHRAEYYFELIVSFSGLAGLIFGYYYQLFSVAVYCLAVGFVLASMISIPPWPMYRRKPLKWQKHDPNNFICDHGQPSSIGGASSSSPASATINNSNPSPASSPKQSGKSSKKSAAKAGNKNK